MKTPTITIATCAFNEEDNIKNFLKSVLAQNLTGFKLEKILVVSDGSTDKTVEKVKNLNSTLIKIKAFKKREGKSKRLNQIFDYLKSDILIFFDSDVILQGPNCVKHLAQTFRNGQYDLVGGNPQPYEGKSIIERGVNSSFKVFDKLRVLGYWAYGCDGRILAMSKIFAKFATIPHNMIANDAYMYFLAKTNGYKFKHIRSSIVNYRSPTNIKDQIRQNTRFIAAHHRLKKIFGEVVEQEYKMPPGFYLKETFREFLQNPIDTGSLFLVNLVCRWKAKKHESKLNAIWQITESTKILR